MTLRTISVLLLSAVLPSLALAGAALPASIGAVDAHAHVFVNSPAFKDMLERRNLRVVNICVVDPYDRGFETAAPQHKSAIEVFQGGKGRLAWVSTFDPAGWEEPGFAKQVIAGLEETFRQGAIGVKIYKTIGMLLQSKDGRYLMPDDPVFDPIFEAIASGNKALYAHIAEPVGAWRPLDPADPDYSYYRDNPRWHMFRQPGRPSKEAILAARDRMIARNPKLRVIGCHLGSMEEDVHEIAQRLDRYPNFAVDTAARVRHLALQPREKVRAFLIKYQDRLLYATDDGLLAGEDPAAAVKRWEEDLDRDWKFFSTAETVEYVGRKVQGLALPEPVLRKLYRDNALRWVPGIPAK